MIWYYARMVVRWVVFHGRTARAFIYLRSGSVLKIRCKQVEINMRGGKISGYTITEAVGGSLIVINPDDIQAVVLR